MAEGAPDKERAAQGIRARLYTIPVHRAFADALAAGIVRMVGDAPLDLASGMVLLPNQRAVTAVRDAFIRLRGGATLLPRLVALGDDDLDARAGAALDRLAADGEEEAPLPPVIAPLRRKLLLASMIAADRPGTPPGELLRLADSLARVIDQLTIEEIPLSAVIALRDDAMVAQHWEDAFASLHRLMMRWPEVLAAEGVVDRGTLRNLTLNRTARLWRTEGLPGAFVVAAGISTSAPAIAGLLRSIALADKGVVVLPHVDLAMADEDWQALGPDPRRAAMDRAQGEKAAPSREGHPQFHLKLLLERMGFARGEVEVWPDASAIDGPPSRIEMTHHLLALPGRTSDWPTLPPSKRRVDGIRTIDAADNAAEAQVIALAMREVLDEPGRTAALVTPDRAIARRVAGHLSRWGIEVDDSAGDPLPTTPAGALLLQIAALASNGFSPVDLIAVLSHPLVAAGEGRRVWLDKVRVLDLALRGPRPAPGLAPLESVVDRAARKIADGDGLRAWWAGCAAALASLNEAPAKLPLDQWLMRLRGAVKGLAGSAIWLGADGRALAELVENLALHAPALSAELSAIDLQPVLRTLMGDIDVRSPRGGHPRLFIWGLLEGRLQRADRMILAGLNEGQWPQPAAPDPWLAPLIRRQLGLPGLDRNIGLAAHDFASALGAGEVLLTRSARDAAAPTIASRLRLRFDALTGGHAEGGDEGPSLLQIADALDRCDDPRPVDRPAPCPPPDRRPRRMGVTDADVLLADPFVFLARAGLGLRSLDALNADPTPAWRGIAAHDILERWLKTPERSIATMDALVDELLSEPGVSARQRVMWGPRLRAPLQWMAGTILDGIAAGRVPIEAASERRGQIMVGGMTLVGRPDRIDRLADGTLAIVDYKTGGSPKSSAVNALFAIQLGLLGAMAEMGAFLPADGTVGAFEYWRLNKATSAARKGELGWIDVPFRKNEPDIEAGNFAAAAYQRIEQAIDRWIEGDAPFTARLEPTYAGYTDYDQLMRLEEWLGRDRSAGARP